MIDGEFTGPPSEAPPDEHSLERLANRVALLVSSDSESDNAGRAVAAMARRLGLSGGDLKAMFLAGAAAEGRTAAPRERSAAAALRDTVGQLETSLRIAERRVLTLGYENNQLRAALLRARRWLRLQSALGGLLLLALLGGALYVALAWPTDLHGSQVGEAAGGPQSRVARVGANGATLFADVDARSVVLARLPPGTKLPVRALVWHSLSQWALADVGPNTGYVSVTELVLP